MSRNSPVLANNLQTFQLVGEEYARVVAAFLNAQRSKKWTERFCPSGQAYLEEGRGIEVKR
jgi:hypothetical protein